MDVNSLLALLDSRKAGKLSVDNVLSFLQLLSNAPTIDDAHKLFRSFDTSSSGELDAQAFSGLLNALEALLNRPTSAIIKEFLAKQFERFFITVCEISKSPSANSPKPIKERYIDKKDVQSAMESTNMFPAHWTSTDKINLFKKRFTYNTLSFDDFCTLFATCIEGKNLAEIQRSFEDAQQRRLAARSAFEGGGGTQPNRIGQTLPAAAGGLASRLAAFTGGQPNQPPPATSENMSNPARPPPPPPRPPIPEVKIPPQVAASKPQLSNQNLSAGGPNPSSSSSGGGGGGVGAVNSSTGNQQLPPTALSGATMAGKPLGGKKQQDEEKKEEIKLAPALAFLSQPLKPDKKEEEKKKAVEDAKKAAEAKAEEEKIAVDPKILKEAFNLMDVRKTGGLRVNDVVSFCQHLPQENMPVVSTLHKIYKDADADGSGEIEMDEFLDFMIGLENLTHMKAADMLAAAVREMYRRLFDMADEDKGGTIGRDELSLLMDCVSGMKASEVERVTKTFPEELGLDDFCEVIKRLTKGRSIAEVTAAFMEGKLRRAASAEYSKKLEEEQRNKEAGEKGECRHCVEKRKKVASLMSQVEALQTQVDAEHEKSAEKSIQKRRRFASVKKGDDESGLGFDAGDIIRGNLWETMYSRGNVFSAPFYSGCPALARPLMLRLASSRINGVADAISVAAKETKSNADAAARWINENSPAYFDTIQELRVITDTFKIELKQFLVLYEKLLQVVVSNTEFNATAAKTHCEEILVIRARCATMRADLERCSDAVVELRVEAANRILCAAPFTNIPADMAKCSGDIESATLQLRDIIAVALQLASSQLSDVEVWARRLLEKTHDRVTAESITEMKAFLSTSSAKLSSDQINDVIRSLDDTFREAQYTLRRTATYRRDKGVMTLSEEEIMAELEALKLAGQGADDDDDARRKGGKDTDGKGRHVDPSAFAAARTRRMIDKSVDAIKEIDRALQIILKERPDVPLPPNFCRVDPTHNSFTFGTRVIELVPVDREAAVKVGGGYMFLEEFCKRNFEQEVRKLEWANKKFETTKVKIGNDERTLRSQARALSSSVSTTRKR